MRLLLDHHYFNSFATVIVNCCAFGLRLTWTRLVSSLDDFFENIFLPYFRSSWRLQRRHRQFSMKGKWSFQFLVSTGRQDLAKKKRSLNLDNIGDEYMPRF
jgi:hypothetical protein